MDQFIEIHWTSGSIDEARRISRMLVEGKYVACAQIIPWIESIYIWDDKLQTEQESKIVFKALISRFDEIKDLIIRNCSYQVPEITYQIIVGGNQAYLEWLQNAST